MSRPAAQCPAARLDSREGTPSVAPFARRPLLGLACVQIRSRGGEPHRRWLKRRMPPIAPPVIGYFAWGCFRNFGAWPRGLRASHHGPTGRVPLPPSTADSAQASAYGRDLVLDLQPPMNYAHRRSSKGQRGCFAAAVQPLRKKYSCSLFVRNTV